MRGEGEKASLHLNNVNAAVATEPLDTGLKAEELIILRKR